MKIPRPGPEVIFFFMLNSAEHEIFSANINANANSWHFNIYKQRKQNHAQLCSARNKIAIVELSMKPILLPRGLYN